LRPGWTYRAECLHKPRHNVICYDRVPRGHVILFDVDGGEEAYLAHNHKLDEAERLGLECVPLLHVGKVDSADELRALLAATSVLGGSKVEGVVAKNYRRFAADGHALMGKHVSEEFKEVHKKDWRLRNPNQLDVLEDIVASLRTPARWSKAVLHLRERGELEDGPRDIGPLLKEVNRDVLEEEGEAVREKLFKWAWKKTISRGITRGLPEWYKERLLERQFDGTLQEQGDR
ncbi:hypothetical protein LCGC14_3018710, partial [marine sediment metagenome]